MTSDRSSDNAEPAAACDRTETELVRACPLCGSASVRELRVQKPGVRRHDNEYYCRNCKSGVDEPNMRPRQSSRAPEHGGSELVRALAATDPDAVTDTRR